MSHPYRTPASESAPAPRDARDARDALVLDAEIVLLVVSMLGVVHGCLHGFTAIDGAAFAAFLLAGSEAARAVWRRHLPARR